MKSCLNTQKSEKLGTQHLTEICSLKEKHPSVQKDSYFSKCFKKPSANISVFLPFFSNALDSSVQGSLSCQFTNLLMLCTQRSVLGHIYAFIHMDNKQLAAGSNCYSPESSHCIHSEPSTIVL